MERFPWHPYKPSVGLLSNRTPASDEFQAGTDILKQLVKIIGIEKIIAVGEKSYEILNQLGFKSIKVGHPANAGAGKFRQQFSKIIDKPAT